MSHYESDTTRERIIDAAGEIFAERGFEATTVRDICHAAGANVAAVNYYFGDKQRLFVEAVPGASLADESVSAPRLEADTLPREKLTDFIATFIRRVRTGPKDTWHNRLIMREMMRPDAACAEVVRDSIRPQFDLLRKCLRALLPDETSAETLHLTAFSIVGQCLFYHFADPVVRHLIDDGEYADFSVEKLAQHIASFSLAALRPASRKRLRRRGHELDRAENADWQSRQVPGNYPGDRIRVAAHREADVDLLWTDAANMRTNPRHSGRDMWVMDPNVQFIDDVKPMMDTDLYRVRGVSGVSWAVRLYKGLARSRLDNGNFQQTILLGLDDATFVGCPAQMIMGSVFDLRRPDAVIMDIEGYQLLWPMKNRKSASDSK